jgi:hypothetical protein
MFGLLVVYDLCVNGCSVVIVERLFCWWLEKTKRHTPTESSAQLQQQVKGRTRRGATGKANELLYCNSIAIVVVVVCTVLE